MKALSLTQPWATLVALGAKRIETRSWHTTYRGPLAIHAARVFPKLARALCYEKPFCEVLVNDVDWVFGDLPTGAIVATCQLVGVRLIPNYPDRWLWLDGGEKHYWDLTPQERAFGDYTPGRYAWLLADVEPLATPIPRRGALGLWPIIL